MKIVNDTKKLPVALALIVLMCVFTACSDKNDEDKTEYGVITKAGDRLYQVVYDEYEDNQEAVTKIVDEKLKGDSPGCTSIYKEGMLMRNMDWHIIEDGEEVCELVVQTTANEGRYATVGVVYNPLITEDHVDELTDEEKTIIPFVLNDGVNSEGLMFSQNVCPEVDGISVTYGTNSEGENLCNYMLGRQLLDHCANVDEAIDYLKNSNVYMKDNGDGTRMESHFLVADKERAVVIEFVDNEMVVLEQEDLPYEETFITNHYLFNGGEDTGHGMGFHRDEIAKEGYSSVKDWKSGMKLLEKLRYTQAYTKDFGDDFWYDEYHAVTEFEGENVDFNSETPEDDPTFLRFIKSKQEDYRNHTGTCWWTNHSSVYESSTGTLHLVVGERFDEVYTYKVPN